MFFTRVNIILIVMLGFSSIIGANEIFFPVLPEEIESLSPKNDKLYSETLNTTISIYGDKEFLNKSQLYNWSGNGTLSNPFLIKNYNIRLINVSMIGINIQNTTYHFIIENVSVIGGYAGFLLNGVSNAYLKNNIAFGNVRGFNFQNITNTTIEGNIADSNYHSGFEFRYSDSINVIRNNIALNNSFGYNLIDFTKGEFIFNTAKNNYKYGFHLFTANSNKFQNNSISYNQKGFTLFFSDYNQFENNLVVFNEDGFFLESESDHNQFSNNVASENTGHGFVINWGNWNKFTNNKAQKNMHGFSIYYGEFNSFDNNIAFENNNYGFFFDQITQNNIAENNSGCGNMKGSFQNLSNKNFLSNNNELNICNIETTVSITIISSEISQTTPAISNSTTQEQNQTAGINSFITLLSLISILGLASLRKRNKKN